MTRFLYLVAIAILAAKIAGRPGRPRIAPTGPVLIYGDSQAGGLGRAMATVLERRGLTVAVVSHPGKSTAWLAENVPQGRYGTVFVLSGDNDGARGPSETAVRALVNAVRSRSGTPMVYWVGPSPLTLVGDSAVGVRVWGSDGARIDYWTRRGYAQTRREVLADLGTDLRSMGVIHIRLDELNLPGSIEQPSGLRFPTLADGLHVNGAVARAAAEKMFE